MANIKNDDQTDMVDEAATSTSRVRSTPLQISDFSLDDVQFAQFLEEFADSYGFRLIVKAGTPADGRSQFKLDDAVEATVSQTNRSDSDSSSMNSASVELTESESVNDAMKYPGSFLIRDAGLFSYTLGLLGAAAFMALAVGPGWLGFVIGFLPASLLASWAVSAHA